MEWIGQTWDLIILNPLINVLIVLSDYLFNSFGLTIIVLTIVIRAAMYPLTRRQLRATKTMQALQAQVAEVRKKYEKDKQKAAQEQMKLYKQSGMNPFGCLGPMVIQMPVWIALYQSIIRVLATAPEDFLSLSQRLYSSWPVFSLLPLENQFLWLNLAVPDPWMILPILVFATMWVQQKMIATPIADPRQKAQSDMMQWLMPIMFAFLTLSFPSGLALYWVTSNIVTIVMQYFVVGGWGGLKLPFGLGGGGGGTSDKRIKGRVTQQESSSADDGKADIVVSSTAQEEGIDDGKSGDKRQDRRGSYSTRLRSTRRRTGRSRDNRSRRR